MASLPGRSDPGGSGLLRGARTRSYGSLVQSSYSPALIRKVDHPVQPGDTLQGLALKYGVTMEQIKRANRLYTNDSIFLKKSLCIPVAMDQPGQSNGPEAQEETGGRLEEEGSAPSRPEKGGKEKSSSHAGEKKELSASDFLTRLDTKIRVSKRAAVKKLRAGETFAGETLDCTVTAGYQGSSDGSSRAESPRTQQRSLLKHVPLTITTRASTLRDYEDEIFKL